MISQDSTQLYTQKYYLHVHFVEIKQFSSFIYNSAEIKYFELNTQMPIVDKFIVLEYTICNSAEEIILKF